MLLKIEKLLFYLFLFLIPFQIRIFLNNNGEWNSIFIYLGDLIFLAVLVLWIINNKIPSHKLAIKNKKNIFLFLFLLIAFISVFVSSGTKISAFRFLKLLEFAILFIYIFHKKEAKILHILFYSGILQGILAITQFIKQGSINIKFIEAGVFSPDSPGVANFILNGDRILRSYGSFSHPNVLAGFLLMTIFAFYAIWQKKPINILRCIGFAVLVFAMFLTFSRTAIVVFGVMSLIFFLFEFFKLRKLEHTEQRLIDGKKLIKLFLLFIVSCLLAVMILFPCIKARFFTISLGEQAVDLRIFYNKMAIEMIKEKPILGIGVGNFVNYSQNYSAYLRAASKMIDVPRQDSGQLVPSWIYQPVHNIYLLIASEIGILGVLAFLGFVAIVLLDEIKKKSAFLLLTISFLILALLDHYFWTLQSGGIMFWLALALTQKE
ncbi:O-antigen ligase family protein [Patescibacteria group bacterium]|nr:O-antigen ligase family protein [Patescibacteria group bacterium]MBU4458699.1 O-antigen ligase family protein [Patescibacteria group bacterium]MCG2696294.1 O-antigen ligase family protein [Candidatus Portnoybacteria bacterium]